MTVEDLLSVITRVYGGDLTAPDYSFITSQMEQRPYDSLIQQLGALDSVQLSEHTDTINYVAFAYKVDHPQQEWVLELSMLGRLAVLARTGDHQWQRLMYPDDQDLHVVEQEMFAVFAEHQIEFPSRATLELPIDMTLDYTDPENARVYHALFSDEDFVPWEFSPLYPELSRRWIGDGADSERSGWQENE
ncbi:hypothetical protein FHR81_002738 [Actinoalloteichus hoggarensis]|uniref:hypothetical protein n=1 Tax=Actinoalloteichus hoggarensis TaxID=1470176 RepID=UPI0012FD50CC|nr:hypothetical protein [Actinoalloteichus hoggarensis]MBB5921698.1 hypothetical protein [Actinoalloteichus hoggarensis]